MHYISRCSRKQERTFTSHGCFRIHKCVGCQQPSPSSHASMMWRLSGYLFQICHDKSQVSALHIQTGCVLIDRRLTLLHSPTPQHSGVPHLGASSPPPTELGLCHIGGSGREFSQQIPGG